MRHRGKKKWRLTHGPTDGCYSALRRHLELRIVSQDLQTNQEDNSSQASWSRVETERLTCGSASVSLFTTDQLAHVAQRSSCPPVPSFLVNVVKALGSRDALRFARINFSSCVISGDTLRPSMKLESRFPVSVFRGKERAYSPQLPYSTSNITRNCPIVTFLF